MIQSSKHSHQAPSYIQSILKAFCDVTTTFNNLKTFKTFFGFCFLVWLMPTQLVMSQVTPMSFETLYSEALTELDAGNYQVIIDSLGNQLTETYPEEIDGFTLYSSALEKAANNAMTLSRWDDAENYSAKAYDLNPNYQQAMNWAEIAWQNGHNETALQAYQKASETPLGKTQAWPRINMATIYSFSGNKAKELSNLEGALELLSPPSTGKEAAVHIDILLKLANCYKANNDIAKAKNSYTAVLQQDPSHALAIQELEKLK